MYLCTVTLNCNFIFTCVILRGTTTILQCPLLRVCLDHAYSCHVMYMSCGSTRVEVHILWEYLGESIRLMKTHTRKYTHGRYTLVTYTHGRYTLLTNTHVLTSKTQLPSLSHYITPIFCWLTSTMSRIVSSVVHIKS